MKFAHIADTHIRNLKYHREYKIIFNKIYNYLQKEDVDYIVHCGDICHTKTQISPEFVQMCSDFFKNLADIAPTYIILGNHDGNLRNVNRQDSLSPIVSALGHKNLHLLKQSGEVHLDDNFSLNVLSVFDDQNWVPPSDLGKVNIALYHGSITGCVTDTDYVMEVGDNDIGIFEKFDYAMLGDIHKTNQILDEEGRVRYAGSTVQQNFGETFDKGFLIWNIQDKRHFSVKHVPIANPKPFMTLNLNEDGKLPSNIEVPEGARVRLVSEYNLPSVALKKAADVAQKRYKPDSITVLNKSTFKSNVKVDEEFEREDLCDLAVQKKLIGEYLEDYSLDDQLMSKVIEINKKYIHDESDYSYRNANYQILNLEWENLFNYGLNNSIDFMELDGIVGIFGKNFSGKSSIIDCLLYTLFNSISKNSRKNLNIVNNDETEGWGKVRIQKGNNIFTISRKTSKYLKKVKGRETVEAKTIVDFESMDIDSGAVTSHNGLTRADTDKNIIKYFGTIEDFLLTSMSSQLGAFSFIEEGSTKRKEILAKFLGLDIFEKKYKDAKEDAAELKSNIKLFSQNTFSEDIKELKGEVKHNKANTKLKKADRKNLKKEVELLQEEIVGIGVKIESVPAKFVDIDKVNAKVKNYEKDLLSLESDLSIKEEKLLANKLKLKEDKTKEKGYDIASLNEKMETILEHKKELQRLNLELVEQRKDLESKNKQIEILSEVPCGSEFSHCKFIKGAYEAKKGIDIVEMALKGIGAKKKEIEDTLSRKDYKNVVKSIEDHTAIKEALETTRNNISSGELMLENVGSKITILKHKIEELQREKRAYDKNEEAIKNLDNLMHERANKRKVLEAKKRDLVRCEEDLLTLHKSNGHLEQKIDNIVSNQEEYELLRSKWESYELFLKCMHPNGIAYSIIKKSLPIINGEISKILADVVDFKIFFETDGNRLDISIQHPDRDESPLEMASGAEKTVAAMAIRLAFTRISSVPKSQLLILDEPGTALDAERMEGFVRVLESSKSIFRTVILISHLDSLKDATSKVLTIENRDGYANVSVH